MRHPSFLHVVDSVTVCICFWDGTDKKIASNYYYIEKGIDGTLQTTVCTRWKQYSFKNNNETKQNGVIHINS